MGPEATAGAGRLKLRHGEGVDTFKRDGPIVTLDLAHAKPDLVAEEVVGTEGGHVHVAADGDKLGSREVVQGQVIFENLADLDDLLLGG